MVETFLVDKHSKLIELVLHCGFYPTDPACLDSLFQFDDEEEFRVIQTIFKILLAYPSSKLVQSALASRRASRSDERVVAFLKELLSH